MTQQHSVELRVHHLDRSSRDSAYSTGATSSQMFRQIMWMLSALVAASLLTTSSAYRPSVGASLIGKSHMRTRYCSSWNRNRRLSVVSLPAESIAQSMMSKSAAISNTLNKVTAALRAVSPVQAIQLLVAGVVLSARSKLKQQVQSLEGGWSKRGAGGSFMRTIEVWGFAFSYAFKYLAAKQLKNGNPEAYVNSQRALARSLTDKLLELGPTFIKLGQLLSTRVDVLSKEFIAELSQLQDQVPGFPGDVAVSIIETEIGRPIDQIFDTFNRTALAAASLGQVHLATLNGQTLAVKIQRRGLKALFDADLKNIKVLSSLLDRLDPKSDGAQRDWASIYDESAKLLYKEIDYKLEARNCIRFKENFADTPWVKVPNVLLNLTTSNMLTMEYVPGIKINNIARIEEAGIDRAVLARRSAESYLTQLCRHGFFHCDPHPGNLACDAEEGGRLIYYDFGMMDELKPNVKKGLVDLLFGVYENDPREVCDALEEVGVLRRGVDRVSIEKLARAFLKEFARGIRPGEKWASDLSKEQQRELARQRRQQLGADLFSIGNDVPFKFPPTFTFVFRAFTSLDGIGKGLDTKYDLTRLAQPYLKELIDLRDGSATVSVLNSWGKKLGLRPVDLGDAVQQPRKVANIERILTKMEQGDLKLRVRVLESERAFQRVNLVQNNMALGLAASTFLNIGVLLSVINNPTTQQTVLRRGMFALAALFGLQVPVGILRLSALDRKLASIS